MRHTPGGNQVKYLLTKRHLPETPTTKVVVWFLDRQDGNQLTDITNGSREHCLQVLADLRATEPAQDIPTDYLAEIGARGRAANSQAQAQASAINGKRGGRPINPNSKRQQKLHGGIK